MLRIEDIDRERCCEAFVAGIVEDLAWLGLAWDGPVVIQSERATAHSEALDRLRAMGLLYPCVCTRADIAMSAPHRGEARYPGTCRSLCLEAGDTRPVAWRLDVERALALTGDLMWHDEIAGTVAADPLAGGDIVLARKMIGIAYHLAVVVDDAAAGVTDVVRAHDLFAATHVQRLLQALLGLPTPRYRHHALVLGPHGKRLAKRTPGATLAGMRVAGVEPARLLDDLRQDRLPIGFTTTSP